MGWKPIFILLLQRYSTEYFSHRTMLRCGVMYVLYWLICVCREYVVTGHMFGKCLPSFIIAGTQKSGTTALAGLTQQPWNSLSSSLRWLLCSSITVHNCLSLFIVSERSLNYSQQNLSSPSFFTTSLTPLQRLSAVIHKSALPREKNCISSTARNSTTKALLITWILFAFGILPRTRVCSLILQVSHSAQRSEGRRL